MKTIIQRYLMSLQKKTIRLAQLEKLVPATCSYQEFADTILSLESQGILMQIKSHGTNGKHPSLALGYRVRMEPLHKELHREIANARLWLHPAIQLESYFTLLFSVWTRDLPYIKSIDLYLKTYPLPTAFAPAPERSYQLVGNEKWITDLGGKELLERIKLWDQLLIMPVADPLMFAVNPFRLQDSVQHHLIVENKTTYQALLPVLCETSTATLIYGVGNKIVKSIENFHYQLPVPAVKHYFHYFGDLDFEGVNIWYRLSKKCMVLPALPFYELALSKSPPRGKEYQSRNDEGLNTFSGYLSDLVGERLLTSLSDGFYYPQEILTTDELQECWRNLSWNSMN